MRGSITIESGVEYPGPSTALGDGPLTTAVVIWTCYECRKGSTERRAEARTEQQEEEE